MSVVEAKRRNLSTHRAEHARLVAKRDELLALADRRPDVYARVTLAYLTAQTLVLWYWVYWRFDWTLCEPITYLLGTAVVWIQLLVYMVTGGEYEWDALRKRIAGQHSERLFKQHKFDPRRITRLEAEIALLQEELAPYDEKPAAAAPAPAAAATGTAQQTHEPK